MAALLSSSYAVSSHAFSRHSRLPGHRCLRGPAIVCEDGHRLAYEATYGSEASVDQACYESKIFWKQVAEAVPGFHDAPELERYRGWVANLITKDPGECTTLETGQELLTQYIFPGLQDPETVERTPFPALTDVEDALRRLAPTAQAELAALLRARPLIDDDAPLDDDEAAAEVWNRAAWYGWQFLALRDAKPWMPRTIRALEASVPVAHRFIGIARQRAGCRGTLHSDRRNYLLSTLTGLDVPEGKCAGHPCVGRRAHAACTPLPRTPGLPGWRCACGVRCDGACARARGAQVRGRRAGLRRAARAARRRRGRPRQHVQALRAQRPPDGGPVRPDGRDLAPGAERARARGHRHHLRRQGSLHAHAPAAVPLGLRRPGAHGGDQLPAVQGARLLEALLIWAR